MVTLTLNGRVVEVDAPDDMPLLWVLRDTLRLTGTKFGCGLGQCGACTVHVNGQAMKTCQLPVRDVAGAEIKTIEGLSPDGSDPVQLAWVMEQVPQCGYCQSGQIMTAESLLRETPNPSDEEITATMTGNLCRCMAYTRIHKAIKTAANGGEGKA